MLNIGDYALHQRTGQVGQVCGYGHQVMDGVYTTTLKVRVSKHKGTRRQSRFFEDAYSAWMLTKEA
ncbi:hypothetical protein HUN01_33280 [Nostoc edaphicum CCNP1411]|uniref:Uncharacterized protein n=1 Tax=Nostoc edaphicum CCNP1411 TaxID=1472755 RepID=A0A7D7QRU6_9NOSO|nr:MULTISPECIES: hypothetical protein [Nostoc]ODG97624.1 hypothetical protein A4S05_13085 [Nostoc sp. KVJ20]QMS92225.1 hypothetical protein HUN01_33280 [Nostoc edaphicum CCNP1411]